MELTTAMLRRFVGGQIEIQNEIEGYIYRGEIATAVVEKNTFRVTCTWLAKGVGNFPAIHRWVKDDRPDYAASLEIYSVSDIGPGTMGGNRLYLRNPFAGESVVLFPPDGSKLDRMKVEGLEPVPA